MRKRPRWPNSARWREAGPTCWPRWPASSRAPARANRTSRWPGPPRGCAAWPGPTPVPYRPGSRRAAAARRTPGARRSPARAVPARCGPGSERGLVGEAAAAVGRPWVGVPAAGAAGAGTLAAGRPAAALVPLAPARTVPRGPVDLGRGVPQRGADVVDLHLVHGPLLALLRLVRPLPQPPRDDHPHPPRQRLGHVLRRLPPHVTGQEQAVPVLPLTRGVISEPG